MSLIEHQENTLSTTLSQLPGDELRSYAKELGLKAARDARQGEILRLIRERHAVLRELDRKALLEICVWARRPVRKSASKEELAKEISTITKMRFSELPDQGLRAICKLNSLVVSDATDRPTMIRMLKKAEPLSRYITRHRRRWVGSLVAKLISGKKRAADLSATDYQFLPEDDMPLKERIEEEGLVGGLTRKIKGVADDYVHEKLDEIERRIDHKLDEIDLRLSEWRDREIRNRLRIIKLTIMASIVVAIISLGYDYAKSQAHTANATLGVESPAP